MKDDLDSLLSKGGLSGAERERVLENVLNRVAPARARRRSPVTWIAGTGLALAAAVALVVHERTRAPEFAARGGLAAGAHVEVLCLDATIDACPRGSHLVFSTSGVLPQGYLSAYAEPEEGGERIWYFSVESESPKVGGTSPSDRPLGRVIVLGAEHAPGAYTLHVLVADRELARLQILHPPSGSILLSESVHLQVTP